MSQLWQSSGSSPILTVGSPRKKSVALSIDVKVPRVCEAMFTSNTSAFVAASDVVGLSLVGVF